MLKESFDLVGKRALCRNCISGIHLLHKVVLDALALYKIGINKLLIVIPAQAGIQIPKKIKEWIPVFTGMT